MDRFVRYTGLGFILTMAVIFSFQQEVLARQGLFSGRAQGTVSADATRTTLERVTSAAKKVFIDDGFKVASESATKIVFERPARLGKDIAYSGFANEEGSWERVEVLISDQGNGNFQLGCNPFIVTDKGDDFFEDQEQVLKMFAGEYRRLLNRVAGEASGR